ncbi:polysaccharide deacetylase family protein [Zhihengliuella halotolerans]|uniref:Polysaccharide deacetylase n=1 Tax=Zhihengliuella halotolerans TaxID=370736 RepID=A0A4Q8ACZ4_9MICC|nr:polysaccharide deacetylase family protein [Zhihengliuella halotolerans]RZU62048.1 polysaccharide deacetylase [Zhihengliuella halotolerans]
MVPKRVRCFVAAAVLALALSGCGLSGMGADEPAAGPSSTPETEPPPASEPAPDSEEKALETARLQVAQYDYAAALETVEGLEGEMAEAVRADVKEQQGRAREWPDNATVPHLFFHSLIVDPERAFAPGPSAQGYDDYMVTLDEFEAVLASLYERGYVLVDPHDLATMRDGVMTANPILLPEGKKPLVLSQDDVNYYEYMTGDGFATDLALDDDGAVTSTYIDADGEVHRGAYDLPTVVDAFVAEHPDFSYRGSKGVLAVTGYNGVLGYRSSATEYGTGAATRKARAEAKKVATALKDSGWMFASHTWGHLGMTDASMARITRDAERWDAEVRPIIGDTDLLIYPFGADISGVPAYSGAKYRYLKSLGFDYFFGVDATRTHWVQQTDDYLRQARINVDGLTLRAELEGKRDVLGAFFDVEDVYDSARPD